MESELLSGATDVGVEVNNEWHRVPRGTSDTKDDEELSTRLAGTTEDKWVEATTILGEVTVICRVIECCRGATLSREDGRKAGTCAFSK